MNDAVYNVTVFLAYYLPALLLLSGLCALLLSVVTRTFRVMMVWAVLAAVPLGLRSIDVLCYHMPAQQQFRVAPKAKPEQTGRDCVV